MNHLHNNSILSDAQHGFRKSRSCETQRITLINDLAKSFNDASQSDAAFLDFSKNFDKVNHRKHCLKLEYFADLSTVTASPCVTRFRCLSHGLTVHLSFLTVLQILSRFFPELTVFLKNKHMQHIPMPLKNAFLA